MAGRSRQPQRPGAGTNSEAAGDGALEKGTRRRRAESGAASGSGAGSASSEGASGSIEPPLVAPPRSSSDGRSRGSVRLRSRPTSELRVPPNSRRIGASGSRATNLRRERSAGLAGEGNDYSRTGQDPASTLADGPWNPAIEPRGGAGWQRRRPPEAAPLAPERSPYCWSRLLVSLARKYTLFSRLGRGG